MENVFHNAINNKESTKKPIKRKTIGKEVLVDNSVIVVYDTNDTESYDDIKTLDDVLRLQSSKPNVLLGIKPRLYSSFVNHLGLINPYVKKGDKVKYKNSRQADVDGNPVRTVSSVYLFAIAGMSIICASFEEGDYALTSLLTVVNAD